MSVYVSTFISPYIYIYTYVCIHTCVSSMICGLLKLPETCQVCDGWRDVSGPCWWLGTPERLF